MIGWLNWALNTYPKLCSGLAGLYTNISGITEPHKCLQINSKIAAELNWFANHMWLSSDVHFLMSIDWVIGDNDEILVTMFLCVNTPVSNQHHSRTALATSSISLKPWQLSVGSRSVHIGSAADILSAFQTTPTLWTLLHL